MTVNQFEGWLLLYSNWFGRGEFSSFLSRSEEVAHSQLTVNAAFVPRREDLRDVCVCVCAGAVSQGEKVSAVSHDGEGP